MLLFQQLKMAWRSLVKDKFYTGLNVLGLSLAMAAFLLIIYYVRFEYSYENFYTRAGNIVRVTLDMYKGNEYVASDCETHPPLAPLLKKDFPEVVDAARIQMAEEVERAKVGNQHFAVQRVVFADPATFRLFNYDFIEGDVHSLDAPRQLLVTQSEALRLFGAGPYRGKTIDLEGRLFTVSAVIKDLPPNTHLKMNLMMSFATLEDFGWDMNNWNGNNNYTYVQLRPGTDLAQFNAKLKAVARAHLHGDDIYVAQPMKDIHLYSHRSFEAEVNGDSKTVQFMFMVAILIILVGAINYVNLTTARATEKMKEVGIRRILGSSRLALARQFFTETVLVNVIALFCALLLVYLLMPWYAQLVGADIPANPFASVAFWLTAGGQFFLVCALSGIYPALVLANTAPVVVTRRTHTQSAAGAFFRKSLVVGQFVVALMVLSSAFIVYRQLQFLRKQQLGLNTSQVMVVHNAGTDEADSLANRRLAVFKNSVRQLPMVEDVTVAEGVPGLDLGLLSTNNSYSVYGTKTGRGYNFCHYGIDASFIPTMDLELIAGTNFVEGQPNKDGVIITREAARLFGFTNPEAAIGQRITMELIRPADGSQPYAVIRGVMEDYHQQSLKGALLPMIHNYNTTGGRIAIRLRAGAVKEGVEHITSLWQQQFAGYPMDFQFLDALYDQQYKVDMHFGQVVTVFSGFTLFITCLGILGLTAYNITRRTKEIGIRKVLGASITSIVSLLSKDFVKLVGIALLIATPLAWMIMNHWLENFAYHIDIQWWTFAGAGLLTMCIALFTVGWQSLKAALVNPVKSLKAE